MYTKTKGYKLLVGTKDCDVIFEGKGKYALYATSCRGKTRLACSRAYTYSCLLSVI